MKLYCTYFGLFFIGIAIITGNGVLQAQAKKDISHRSYSPEDSLLITNEAGKQDGTAQTVRLEVGIRDTVFIYGDEGLTAGWNAGSFFLQSPDGENLLTIGGRIQSRYEYSDRSFDENLSSFFLRRIRVDFNGEFFDGRVTWRIMPELARNANLRDGWIDYQFNPMLRLRAGQFVVPFQWLRSVSGNRQHFQERGNASENWFGAPGGYDSGVGLHGRNASNNFAYGIGIFDGFGRNTRLSNSAGNMISGRLTWAVFGILPREEPDIDYTENLNLTIGAGLQAANKNEVREWSLRRSPAGNERADWITGTADIALHRKGLSLVSTSYLRRVDPDDSAIDSYTSIGQVVSAGYFFIPKKFEIVGRYSNIFLDRDNNDTRQTDWGAGLNIYHSGHNLKTQVNYERLDQELIGTEHVIRVQLHMQF